MLDMKTLPTSSAGVNGAKLLDEPSTAGAPVHGVGNDADNSGQLLLHFQFSDEITRHEAERFVVT